MSEKLISSLVKATAVLLLSCIIFATVSCADNEAEMSIAEENAAADEEITADITTAETTTEDYLAKFNEVDVSGRTFRIIAQDTEERNNFYHEDTAGDIINDSINDRDNKVREELGIEFEFIAYEDRKACDNRAKTILAGDDAYDMIITSLPE